MPEANFLDGLPDPWWFVHTYDIRWIGPPDVLSGHSAKVIKIRDEGTKRWLVVRLSDPARIDATRLSQVHRFLEHLNKRGVRTPLPIRTHEGQTYAVHRESGRLVEVFPYVEGRPPQVGDISDAQRVATALAQFHNAGLCYEDLPDEESCDQNHVALERLRTDIRKAISVSAGKVFEPLLREYVSGAEALIASLKALRPGLVHTGLHLDASPNNVIFSESGDVWLIDCSHAIRGRRVFDVVTATYYMDLSCHAKPGDLRRYQDVDSALESAFLVAYRSACEPAWRDEETKVYTIERQLMLVHGAVYWATECPDAEAMQELVGFRKLKVRF